MERLVELALLLLLSPPREAKIVPLHTVELKSCGGHYCIEASTAAGPKLRLALDLASERSYLKASVVKRMGLATEPLIVLKGKAVPGYSRTERVRFTMSGIDLGFHSFYVSDSREVDSSSGVAGRVLSADEDGGIASDLLQDRLVEVDTRSRQLSISERLSEPVLSQEGNGELKMDRNGDFGPMTLVASGFVVGRYKITVRIDTIFREALYLSAHINPLIYATKSSAKKATSTFKGIPLRPYGVTSLRCGDYVLSQNVQVWAMSDGMAGQSPFQAIIGLGAFRLCKFRLDFKANRVSCRA
jgi:hypothetical protein